MESAFIAGGTQAVVGGGLSKFWDKGWKDVGEVAEDLWKLFFVSEFTFSAGTLASIISSDHSAKE